LVSSGEKFDRDVNAKKRPSPEMDGWLPPRSLVTDESALALKKAPALLALMSRR
jgi:hypothetical protein